MSSYYFINPDGDVCLTKDGILEHMKDEGLTELIVFEAERLTGINYFFCHFYDQVGEVGEGCGKQCGEYKPNNGRSGRCTYSGWCYSQTGKRKTFRIKEVKK
jgi:hypothetical protein